MSLTGSRKQPHRDKRQRGAGPHGGIRVLQSLLKKLDQASQRKASDAELSQSLVDPADRVSKDFGCLLLSERLVCWPNKRSDQTELNNTMNIHLD